MGGRRLLLALLLIRCNKITSVILQVLFSSFRTTHVTLKKDFSSLTEFWNIFPNSSLCACSRTSERVRVWVFSENFSISFKEIYKLVFLQIFSQLLGHYKVCCLSKLPQALHYSRLLQLEDWNYFGFPKEITSKIIIHSLSICFLKY